MIDPQKSLPVGIWDHPRPEDLQVHDDFVQAWFATDEEVRQFYETQLDESNITLSALAYQCITRGLNQKRGNTINVQVNHWKDDGSWSSWRYYWYGTECDQDPWEPANQGYTHTFVHFGKGYSIALHTPAELPPSDPVLETQNSSWFTNAFLKFRGIVFPRNVVIDYADIVFMEDPTMGSGTECGNPLHQVISADLKCSPVETFNSWEDFIGEWVYDQETGQGYYVSPFSRTINRKAWDGEVECYDCQGVFEPSCFDSPNIACVIQEVADHSTPLIATDILILVENKASTIFPPEQGWGARAADAGLRMQECIENSGNGAILRIWYHVDYDMSGGVVVNGKTENITEMRGGVTINGSARQNLIVNTSFNKGVVIDGHSPLWWNLKYTATGSVYIDNWDIELWLPFEIASDSTANDISGRERHARMRNMYHWQYVTGKIGTKALRFGDVNPPVYTVTPSGGVVLNGSMSYPTGGVKLGTASDMKFTLAPPPP